MSDEVVEKLKGPLVELLLSVAEALHWKKPSIYQTLHQKSLLSIEEISFGAKKFSLIACLVVLRMAMSSLNGIIYWRKYKAMRVA